MAHKKDTACAKTIFSPQAGFTLIELFVVLMLMGVTMAILVIRTGTYSFWREEGFVRQLSETLIFLHNQAIVDQAFYRIEFDLDKRSYSVGVIRPEYSSSAAAEALGSDVGHLSLELAAFTSPAIGSASTLIPPPSFPSLAVPVPFAPEVVFTDIRTMRGKVAGTEGGKPYILFSPRGFSEFAVLHLENSSGEPITILINPFSGNTTIYREYKDFKWTYGKNNKKA